MIYHKYLFERKHITCILILHSLFVSSQGMTLNGGRFLSAASGFEHPADELKILPDTHSYYVIEELFNADTLTRKGNKLTFYNYGDIRYAIYGDLNTGSYVNKIIKFEKVSDTFSMQTTINFERGIQKFDTTLIWWRNGLIKRALVKRDKKPTIEYDYLYDKNRLIQRTIQNPGSGKTEIKYLYENDLLTKIEYQNDQKANETHFHHTDSLVTANSISKSDKKVYRSRTFTRYDTNGKKTSLKVFMQKNDDPEKLYQSEDYTYFPDGGFRMIATQHNPDIISTMEFHPGYPFTEQWTWDGSDQVLLVTYFTLY